VGVEMTVEYTSWDSPSEVFASSKLPSHPKVGDGLFQLT
jgi:hypothetical protein